MCVRRCGIQWFGLRMNQHRSRRRELVDELTPLQGLIGVTTITITYGWINTTPAVRAYGWFNTTPAALIMTMITFHTEGYTCRYHRCHLPWGRWGCHHQQRHRHLSSGRRCRHRRRLTYFDRAAMTVLGMYELWCWCWWWYLLPGWAIVRQFRIVFIVSFYFGHLFYQFPRSVPLCLTVARP